MDATTSPIRIADTQGVFLQNIVFRTSGAWMKRWGHRKYITAQLTENSAPVAIMSMFIFTTPAKEELLVCSTNTAVYVVKNGVYETIKTGLSGPITSYCPAMGALYMTNGIDPVFKWDGVNVFETPSIPRGRYMAWYQNRLFVANQPGAISRLSYSQLLAPENFTPGANGWEAADLDFAAQDGYGITQIIPYLDRMLVVFKENSIHCLLGSSPDPAVDGFEQRNINGQYGCIAPNSVALIGNDVYFLSGDGIRVLTPTTVKDVLNTQLISVPVESYIRNITAPTSCVAINYDDMYLLTAPFNTSGSHNVFMYDSRNKGFSVWEGIRPVYLQQKAYNYLYATEDGYIFINDRDCYSDDGAPIETIVRTKVYAVNTDEVVKKWKKAFLVLSKETGHTDLKIYISHDFGAYVFKGTLDLFKSEYPVWGSATWGNAVWQLPTDVDVYEVSIKGKSRYLQLQFIEKSNSRFGVFGFSFVYRIKEPRGKKVSI